MKSEGKREKSGKKKVRKEKARGVSLKITGPKEEAKGKELKWCDSPCFAFQAKAQQHNPA